MLNVGLTESKIKQTHVDGNRSHHTLVRDMYHKILIDSDDWYTACLLMIKQHIIMQNAILSCTA